MPDPETAEPTFTASRLLDSPDLVDQTSADLAGAFHLGQVEPDAELTPTEVAALVENFRGYVPDEARAALEAEEAEAAQAAEAARAAAGDGDDLSLLGEQQGDPWEGVPAEFRDANAPQAVKLLSEPPEGVEAGLLVAYERSHKDRPSVLAEARRLGLLAPDDNAQES